MGCLISHCPSYRCPIDAIFRVAGKHFLIEAKDSADAGIEANDYAGHRVPDPEEKFDWDKYCLFFKNIKTEECERVRSKHLKLKDLEKKFGKSLMEKYCLKWTNIKGEECERVRSKHLKLKLPKDENTKVADAGNEANDYAGQKVPDLDCEFLDTTGAKFPQEKYCSKFPDMPDCERFRKCERRKNLKLKLPKDENTKDGKDLENKFGKFDMEKYCLKWTNIKDEECERVRRKHLKLKLPKVENTKVAKEEGSDYVSISYDYTNFTPQILKRRGEGKKGGSDYGNGKGKHWDPEKMKLKYCLRFPHMPDCKSVIENSKAAEDGNEADPADPQKKAKKIEKRSK